MTNELRALRQRSRPDNTIVPPEKQATRSPEVIELVPVDRKGRGRAALVGFGLLLGVLAWVVISPPIFTSSPQADAPPLVIPPKNEIAPPQQPLEVVQQLPAPAPMAVAPAPSAAPTPEETVVIHKSVPVRAAQGKVLDDDGTDSFRVVDPPEAVRAP
ncbi:MAG: hypothetical protein J0I10_16535 [Verrucomicrobia bacterium]|nr:hypothetical protein [Verrucomicrobiota bacterium]